MSSYFVDIKEKAQFDLAKLKKDEPKLYAKALKLIGELYGLNSALRLSCNNTLISALGASAFRRVGASFGISDSAW